MSISEETRETLERLCDDPDERIAELESDTPAAEVIEGQVTVFKALSNADRLRILSILRENECCVCELQALLDASQSTVATHLRKLKEAGLVRSRKQGKWSYYRIADTATFDLLDLAATIGAEE